VQVSRESEHGTNVSDAHSTRTNYFTYLEQERVILLLCKLWTKETQTQTDRRLDGQKQTNHTYKHTYKHTHTWEAGVRHVGHILVVLIMREAQSLHTHRCPHGVNKCDCMLAHH